MLFDCFCKHDWVKITEMPVKRSFGKIKWVIVLKCVKCGKIKKITL